MKNKFIFSTLFILFFFFSLVNSVQSIHEGGCRGLHAHLHTIGNSWQLLLGGESTITESGFYRLVENTIGNIVIDADDVVVDLAGTTLEGDSATGSVIEILSEHTNIEILNGKIKGDANKRMNGILSGEDVTLINIKNMKFYLLDNGINFQGLLGQEVQSGKVQDCEFKDCNKGVCLTYVKKTVFENCEAFDCLYAGFDQNYCQSNVFNNCNAFDCLQAGFDQNHCQFNSFNNCKALKTMNDDIDGRAIGFSSASGKGNLFKGCIAEGTMKTVSNFCKGAIGFLLTGTENDMEEETKIIDCVANSSLVLTGSARAYGIFIEPVLFSRTLVEDLKASFNVSDPAFFVASIDWSMCGKYLAIGGDSVGFFGVRILLFNGSALSEVAVFEYTGDINSVNWSPHGKYLAIGGRLIDDVDVRVLLFNGSKLSEVTTFVHGGMVWSVDWSSCGKYLAIGGDLIGGIDVRVLFFNGSTLSEVVAFTHGGVVNSIDWSSCGKYLAIGGANIADVSVRVLEFKGSTLSEVATFTHGGVVNSIGWSPCGKYLAIGGANIADVSVRVLKFDGSTLSEVAAFTHGGVVNSIDWSPCGKYLAIGGANIADVEVRILKFDASTLLEVAQFDDGNDIYSVDWLSSGRYLAIGGHNEISMDNNVRVFELMDAPSRCLIDGNKVCNSTFDTDDFSRQGFGICGSGDNLYIRNIAFYNDVNFNMAVTNVYGASLLAENPKLFDNLWQPPYENCCELF